MDDEIKTIITNIEKLESARALIKRNLENYKDRENNVKKQLKASLKDINKRILEKKNILFNKLYSKEKKVSENQFKPDLRKKEGIRQIPLEETEGFKEKFEDKINNLELKLAFMMENGKDRK